MSTHASIGLYWDKNKVKGIYCHYDGYLKGGVGEILYNIVTDSYHAESLIEMGNRSYLDENDIEDGTYVKQGESWRDNKPTLDSLENFAFREDYNYVWVDSADSWFVACRNSHWEFVPLGDALTGDFTNVVDLDNIQSDPNVSGGINPSQQEVEDFFTGASTMIKRHRKITAADDEEFEDPRINEADELQTRVEDDFDYVITGIERLGREGLLDEAISLLNTLADTLDSAIGIIGNDFESGSEPEEEI